MQNSTDWVDENKAVQEGQRCAIRYINSWARDFRNLGCKPSPWAALTMIFVNTYTSIDLMTKKKTKKGREEGEGGKVGVNKEIAGTKRPENGRQERKKIRTRNIGQDQIQKAGYDAYFPG